MRTSLWKLLAAGSAIALCACSPAQEKRRVGKLGEALQTTGIYSYPSWGSRRMYMAAEGQRMVVCPTTKPTWDAVLLKSGKYGFVPATAIAELPYSVFAQTHSRATMYASRGGDRSVMVTTGSVLADKAQEYQGTPYEWGGNDLNNGVDCSGFVKELVGEIGAGNLPRTAAEQALVGLRLTRLEQLQPGDRLYFREPGDSKISHTGIYIGNRRFIHASHGRGKVATDVLTPGWLKILITARR